MFGIGASNKYIYLLSRLICFGGKCFAIKEIRMVGILIVLNHVILIYASAKYVAIAINA